MQKSHYIDHMINNITRSTADYYKIPVESAARLYLMSTLKQVESYALRQNKRCSPWDPRCTCDDDFDPADCDGGGLGPLDPRC